MNLYLKMLLHKNPGHFWPCGSKTFLFQRGTIRQGFSEYLELGALPIFLVGVHYTFPLRQAEQSCLNGKALKKRRICENVGKKCVNEDLYPSYLAGRGGRLENTKYENMRNSPKFPIPPCFS